MSSPLHKAVSSKDLEKVKELVQQGADVSMVDNRTYTPLLLAAELGCLDIVKYLFENGSSKYERTKDEASAMLLAAGANRIEVMEWLIESGNGDLEDRNLYGSTPILVALCYGTIKTVEWLLNKGARLLDIVDNSQYNAIHLACTFSNWEMVNFLISKGFSPTCKEGNMTPFILACRAGLLEIAQNLAKLGVAVEDNTSSSSTYTSLMFAIEETNNIELVRWLISTGKCDLNITRNYANPLYIAAAKGNIEIIELLVANGAKINTDETVDIAPLHAAADKNNIEVIEWLLQQGCPIDQKNSQGETALIVADSLETIQLLIQMGANPRAKCNRGFDVVLQAACNNKIDVLEYIIENQLGTLDTKTTEGATPLLIAAAEGNLEIMKWLIKHGSSCDERNQYGSNAFLVAGSYGQLEVMKFALENGCSIHDKDYDDFSIQHLVATGFNESCIDVLDWLVYEKGVDVLDKHEVYGKTPIQYTAGALKGKVQLQIIEWLLRAGASLDSDEGKGVLEIAKSKGFEDDVRNIINKITVKSAKAGR